MVLSLQTFKSGRSAVESSSKVAATATVQPDTFGSFKVAFVFGASGFARLADCPSTPTDTLVAGTPRELVTRTVEAGFGFDGAAMAAVPVSRRLVAIRIRTIMTIPLGAIGGAL
jgi:hypothetical protein